MTSDGLARFNRIIGVSSSIELFIKCHLILENFLDGLLGTLIVEPSAWKISRETFSRKVSMCLALGLLSDSDGQSLRAVNGLRNKMAHDLEFSITRNQLEQLVSSLAPPIRSVYQALAVDDEVPSDVLHQLPLVFLPLIMSVGHRLQMQRYECDNKEKLAALRNALAIDEVIGERKVLKRDARPTETQIRESIGLPNPPLPTAVFDLLPEGNAKS